MLTNGSRHCPSERWRDRISNLNCDADLRPPPLERVREALESRGLPMGDRTVLVGVQVSPLLGLVELRAARAARGFIPSESTEKIGAARRLPNPATRSQVRGIALEVKAIATGRHCLISRDRTWARRPADVESGAACRESAKLAVQWPRRNTAKRVT